MNVMILAAGEGTRLKPYTLQKPKPAIPFMSVPLGYFSLSLLDGIKIDNLVVNTFHLPEEIRKLYSSQPPQWKNLYFTSEAAGLLGSGGGIHNAKKYLESRNQKGNFLVLNGDEVILPKHLYLLKDLVAYHQANGGIATLLTTHHPEVGHKFGGAWVDKTGLVNCFAKKDPQMDGITGMHFTGVMILSDRVFKFFKPQVCEENILYETLTEAMKSGEKVFSFAAEMNWFETGNPTDFMHAANWCHDQLLIKDEEYWKEYLKQTIRLFGTNEYLIENDHPSNLQNIKNLVAKVKAGY